MQHIDPHGNRRTNCGPAMLTREIALAKLINMTAEAQLCGASGLDTGKMTMHCSTSRGRLIQCGGAGDQTGWGEWR